jgi:hypothetical protein
VSTVTGQRVLVGFQFKGPLQWHLMIPWSCINPTTGTLKRLAQGTSTSRIQHMWCTMRLRAEPSFDLHAC